MSPPASGLTSAQMRAPSNPRCGVGAYTATRSASVEIAGLDPASPDDRDAADLGVTRRFQGQAQIRCVLDFSGGYQRRWLVARARREIADLVVLGFGTDRLHNDILRRGRGHGRALRRRKSQFEGIRCDQFRFDLRCLKPDQ